MIGVTPQLTVYPLSSSRQNGQDFLRGPATAWAAASVASARFLDIAAAVAVSPDVAGKLRGDSANFCFVTLSEAPSHQLASLA